MKCPKCKKGELESNISYRGFFSKTKVYTYFCPLCNFHNEKLIKISVADYSSEITARQKGKESEAKIDAEFGGFKIKSSGKQN